MSSYHYPSESSQRHHLPPHYIGRDPHRDSREMRAKWPRDLSSISSRASLDSNSSTDGASSSASRDYFDRLESKGTCEWARRYHVSENGTSTNQTPHQSIHRSLTDDHHTTSTISRDGKVQVINHHKRGFDCMEPRASEATPRHYKETQARSSKHTESRR
jgi:hypothetical protein